MFVQAGGIVVSYVYQTNSKTVTSGAPDYTNGNRVLLGVVCANIVLYLLTKLYYVSRNQSRDKKWAAMSGKEQLEYIKLTKDEGNKRLDFRFAY